MTASPEVIAALERLIPVALDYDYLELAISLGIIRDAQVEKTVADVRAAAAGGLKDEQVVQVKAALDTEAEVLRAGAILRRIGSESDVNLVLDWLGAEIEAGGTAVEPEPPGPDAGIPPGSEGQESPPGEPAAALEDGYRPTSGLPKARITCRAWGHSNRGQSSVAWSDDRKWPSRTADNGKVLNATLYVFIVRDGAQIAARRLDHVRTGGHDKGLGNMFWPESEDSEHAGNPFMDRKVRPRKGDQWAMLLTNNSASERTTTTPLADWT